MKINNWFAALASSLNPTGLEEDITMEEEIGLAPKKMTTREKGPSLFRRVNPRSKLKPQTKSREKNAN